MTDELDRNDVPDGRGMLPDLPLRLSFPFPSHLEHDWKKLRWRYETWRSYADAAPLSEVQAAKELHTERCRHFSNQANLALSEHQVQRAVRHWWEHNARLLELEQIESTHASAGPAAVKVPPYRQAVRALLDAEQAATRALRAFYLLMVLMEQSYDSRSELYRHASHYLDVSREAVISALKRTNGLAPLNGVNGKPHEWGPQKWRTWLQQQAPDSVRVTRVRVT